MDEIELSAEDKAMFLLRVARLNAYRQLAQLEKAQKELSLSRESCFTQLSQVEEEDIKRIVQKIYKIDLSTNWTFDVEKGVLRRGLDQQPEQQPEQSG